MGNEWIGGRAVETRSNNNYGESGVKKAPICYAKDVCAVTVNKENTWRFGSWCNGGLREWASSVRTNGGRAGCAREVFRGPSVASRTKPRRSGEV